MSKVSKSLEQFLRTDPELYDLPHPKVAQVLGVLPYLAEVLGDPGVLILQSLLQDLSRTKGQLLERAVRAFPVLGNLRSLGRSEDTLDMATLEGFLAPLRFVSNQGKIFEVERSLDELLSFTDIGSSAPIEFFRPPYRVSYFHFAAHGGGIRLQEGDTAARSLLGAYLTELHVNVSHSAEAGLFQEWAGPAGELLCFEITLVARPLVRASDHRFFFSRMYVGPQMSSMSVSEVLELNWKLHGDAGIRGAGLEELRQQHKAGIEHLTKALLQIHAEGTELVEHNEDSELVRRLKNVGAKKAGKLNRRRERLVDRIIIRHPHRDPRSSAAEGSPTPGGVRQHWRRGHFRWQAHGPAHSLHKLKWMAPMLVGELKSAGPPDREYVVRS